MDDHSDDIRRPLSPRIEVFAGVGRKQWPDDEAQIVAESLEPGAVVSEAGLIPADASERSYRF
jgi:transposase